MSGNSPPHLEPPAADLLCPGTLWGLVQARTRHALDCGAMQPIATHSDYVEQQGVRFLVRVVSSLAGKDGARRPAAVPANPFLPYEPDLHVADVSASHICLLNKFNVVDRHILIVTRAFEDQRALLSARDFGALAHCMAEYPALGFYNGGEAAGASQRHKHLQMVPLPLAAGGPAVPIAPLLGLGRDSPAAARARTQPGLPFPHAFMALDGLPPAAELADAYLSLLAHAGVSRACGEVLAPYNLLLTADWMLLVPRRQEHYRGISINALGFAGALLVRTAEQMALLRTVGPLEALIQVAAAAA